MPAPTTPAFSAALLWAALFFAFLMIGSLLVPAMRPEIGQRLGPFLALLDARYLPLLFTVAPQAYAVYDWLGKSGAPEEIRWLGAVGYEAVYVGAIAWAEYDRGQVGWSIATATSALCFSVAVAVYNYQSEGWGAWLHAGFPLVAYFYTLQMHMAHRPAKPKVVHEPALPAERRGWQLPGWMRLDWGKRQPLALSTGLTETPADLNEVLGATPTASATATGGASQEVGPILRAPRERFEVYAALVGAVRSDPTLRVAPIAQRLAKSETLIGTRRKELVQEGVLQQQADKTYRLVGTVELA